MTDRRAGSITECVLPEPGPPNTASPRWASGSQTVWLSWLILTTFCPIGVGVARFGFERAIGKYVNFGEAMHSETELARRSFTC